MIPSSLAPAEKRSYTRRGFLTDAGRLGAAMCLGWHEALGQKPGPQGVSLSATLSVGSEIRGVVVPTNFIGLSYESAQLANPLFFNRKNHHLVKFFRGLSPAGVLRIGGGSSEYTTYSADQPVGPPPFETFGPDTSKTIKKGTVTSALALRNLRGFLDATDWTCLYGLNLGQGSKENAVEEARAACAILGPRLTALQIGNEPDSFRGRFRPKTYGPDDYLKEWDTFHDAIAASVPGAKFAGPDISNKLAFLTAFAEQAPEYSDIVLLTGHYYAMGPAGNPEMTIDNLLSAQPKRTTFRWSEADVVHAAMKTANLPFRFSEGNSCWNGGQAGVSDVYASALWAADAILHCASLGLSGFNFHGGGDGLYSPIVGSPSEGFSVRPEFFGMQFGQRFAGLTLLPVQLQCSSDRVTAYAGRSVAGETTIAILNKTASPLTLEIAGAVSAERHWKALQLTAPSITAKEGVKLKKRTLPATSRLSIVPYSGWVISL